MEIEPPPRERRYERRTGERRGLIIVNTGDGKGKSTAAFGLALRAFGRRSDHGREVSIYQFMKPPAARFGEHRAFAELGLHIEGVGDGFSWMSKDLEATAELARQGWQRARQAMLAGKHFLLVLDEITYPLRYGWIPLDDVLQALQQRPEELHVCLTGRGCPQEIIDIADTVTEMQPVKHAFHDNVPAQAGIEY